MPRQGSENEYLDEMYGDEEEENEKGSTGMEPQKILDPLSILHLGW